MTIWNSFLSAWRLLTAIPLPAPGGEVDAQPGRAFAWFPLIGLILGLGLAGLAWGLPWLLPGPVVAPLLLGAWVAFSGLLHLDGFIDCCDALLPPRPPERRLEILKDSRVGAFGVVGAICLLLVKAGALEALLDAGQWRLLIVAPVLGRWAMVWAAAGYPPARTEGLAVMFRAGLGRRQVLVASLLAALFVALAAGWAGLALLLLGWLAAVGLARWTMARLPGLTGDVYGATCEVVEVITLLGGLSLGRWL